MLQNGGLDTKLVQNKTYEEYVDISAELAKIEKDVKGEMSTVYGQGPKGYFEKIDIERKTAQQVYERAMASLSPAQQRQLQIHAEAEMDRLGPQAVYQTWVGHNKQEKLSVEQNLKSAKMEIAQLENKKALTAADKANLNSLYAIKEDAEATINAIDQNVQMNPDEFDMGEYVPFFTKRFISGFAQKFAFETKKTDLKTDEVYMKTLEHGQQLSRIAAQGRETRLNAQFQNDITNYQVSSGVSIGALKNIDNYLQGANIDVSKPPLEQVDAMIAAIQKLDPDAKNPVIRARQKESYLRELDQLKNLYNMLQQGGEFDKISLNRSAGLGQVQTSIADLMSRPVIDLLKSGNTLEYMRYNPKSTTKTKSTVTPEEKGNFDAKKKYNYYSSTYDLTNPRKPGQSDADYDKDKQAYIKKQLSKETTTVSVIGGEE